MTNPEDRRRLGRHPRRHAEGLVCRRPGYNDTYRQWEQYAFDPSGRAKVGLRSREWTAVGTSELHVLREMGVPLCLAARAAACGPAERMLSAGRPGGRAKAHCVSAVLVRGGTAMGTALTLGG